MLEEEEKKLFSITQEIGEVVGVENISIDDLNRSLYSYDASMIRAKPCGVIHIKKASDIQPVLKILYNHSVSFTPRLAGTNLSGGATNQKGGFVINLSALNRIIQIDTTNNIAVVEPGVVNIKLQEELEKFGYFYPPDPSSQKVSTIGGNIGENAGGPQCLKYGVTSNNVVKLDVILPDGTEATYSIEDYGPDIMSLFIASEGTLGIVKKAYLKILPIPKYFLTIYSEFKSLDDAMQAVADIIKQGIVPKSLEALDRLAIELTKTKDIEISDETQAVLITEIDSDDKREIDKEQNEILKIFNNNSAFNIKFSDDKKESEKLWKLRKETYPSLAKIANNILVEDGCVPRSELVNTVKKIKKIIDDHRLKANLVFHAGDGNIHPQIVFDERDVKETNRIRRVAKDILKEYIYSGGTISAEHGVGVEKRAFMLWQYDKKTIDLFRRIKKAIDKKEISNPYKKIPITNDLKKLKRKEFEISDNVKAMIEEIKTRHSKKIRSLICGKQTSIKTLPADHSILSSAPIQKILDFDRENLTITVESGIEIKKLKDFLINEEFYISLPDDNGTVGGMIAEKRFVGIRDLILSMDLILSDGSFIRLGGKNIKDTSGYDITKLMIGSLGTLGFITSATFKISKKIPDNKFTKPANITNYTSIGIRIKNAFDRENLFNAFLTEKVYGRYEI
ncbi:MAG: FAD-binding protein [Elusimicrobia bacterium]|nr:FAD-binding protein [Elusimicrobiota bacterium]